MVDDVFVGVNIGKGGKKDGILRGFPADFLPAFPAQALQGPFPGVYEAAGEVQFARGRFPGPDQEHDGFIHGDDAAGGRGGVVVIGESAVGATEHPVSFETYILRSAGWTISKHGNSPGSQNVSLGTASIEKVFSLLYNKYHD
jgi:hypothetical protein